MLCLKSKVEGLAIAPFGVDWWRHNTVVQYQEGGVLPFFAIVEEESAHILDTSQEERLR